MPKRELQGKVVSNKMKDTLVVEVERVLEHPKYKRRYKQHKKYKAHVEEGEYTSGDYNIGDVVVIKECRPISKDKCWKVIKKVSSADLVIETPEEPARNAFGIVDAGEGDTEGKTTKEKIK